MIDQASKLRKIINDIKSKKDTISQNVTKKNAAKVIAITSGKGGVGKSNFTVNLAMSLGEAGKKVVVIDADLGLANIDILLGLIPQYSFMDVINKNKSILDVLINDPSNFRFIAGGSGVQELTKLTDEEMTIFIKNIKLLDKVADYILIDTGAGISESVLRFVMSSDDVVLITTPEPTAITDAYAMLKIISQKDKSKNINLIVNRVNDEREANEIMNKFFLVSKKFLSIDILSLGYILNDELVGKAVRNQEPFYLSYPKCKASKNIKDIANRIINNQLNNSLQDESGMNKFINKFIKFMSA